MYSTEPLTNFVDEYLAYLHEIEPSGATFDGVHTYDDLLEDLSRSAVEKQLRELGGFARRLGTIHPRSLTPVERQERRMLEATIRGRILEFEEIRSWELNPQYYASILAASLASQTIFAYAPISERARRIVSRLRQVPQLIQAARTNIKDPPGIFVKIAVETFQGTLALIEKQLPRTFAELDDLHLLGNLADASTEASHSIRYYLEYLRNDLAPRSRASFRLGRELFEKRLCLEEGLEVASDRLLEIGMRELRVTQAEFQRLARELNHGEPLDAWRHVKCNHPPPGQLVKTVREQLCELKSFVERNAIISTLDDSEIVIAPTPQFNRWMSASMWTPGPFEASPLPSYYYITDVEPEWLTSKQNEYLCDFNYASLWSISIHEVFPGHFAYAQNLRRLTTKLRKSTMFSPTSFVEGWAHYCEQMMLEEGFHRGDGCAKLGQLSGSLIRLARLVVGIRLHTEDWSAEQGMRFFRDEAFMEELSARREAERGASDPKNVVYTAGKLMLLKLRADYRAQQGSSYSLREFHDRLLANGGVPLWLHRYLLLGESKGGQLE